MQTYFCTFGDVTASNAQGRQSNSEESHVLLPCPLPWSGGVRWRLSNTCPVDNFLAILSSIAPSDKFDLLARLRSSENEAEATLGRVLELISSKMVHEAKDVWVDYLIARQAPVTVLPNNSVNLYGGQENLFLGFFGHVFGRPSITECSNGPNVCDRFRVVGRISSELIPLLPPIRGPGNNVQSQIDRFFAQPSARKCSCTLNKNLTDDQKEKYGRWVDFLDEGNVRHKERVCNGNRERFQKEMLEGCWLLPFDVEKIKNIEVFDLSTEVVVGGRSYFLRGATLREGEHFTCYVRKDNRWYYYCGMLCSSGRQISTPVSTGKPQIALYTL